MALLLERTLGTQWPVESFEERVGAACWRTLIEGCAPQRAAPSDVVAGSDVEPALIAVLDGACRTFLRGAGDRQVTLRYSHGGDLVGLLALLDSWPQWAADAVRATRYVRIPVERLRRMLDSDHAFTLAVASEVSAVASVAVHMVVGSTSESMAARVAAHLLEAAEPGPGGESVAHITHKRLADSTGTAREVVTRMLRRFRTDGAVRTGASAIQILDRERLLETVRALDAGVAS